MGIEIKFTNDRKTSKSKLENIVLIIQVIISIITIWFVIYWLNSYKFEKKVEYTNTFSSKFWTTIHDYEAFLYSEFFKSYISTNTWYSFQAPLYKINEIQITNNQNYISFKNYLKLSWDDKDITDFTNLDNKYNEIQNTFTAIAEEMYDEMTNEWSWFTNFSSWLLNKKDKLNNDIYKFSDDIITYIK